MTRKTKISCDVTREADNLLKAYCIKHERSKGYLIEKMIRKFCVDVEPVKSTEVAVVVKSKVKRFVAPIQDDVFSYMKDKGVTSDNEAQKFCDFYESKGWVVGKVKMKCWKAAVRNWLKGAKEKKSNQGTRADIDYDDTSWADPANFKIRVKN